MARCRILPEFCTVELAEIPNAVKVVPVEGIVRAAEEDEVQVKAVLVVIVEVDVALAWLWHR